MRKVYLDGLPRRKEGIDWQKSIGHAVEFEYDDIIGEIKIIEYDKSSKKIKIIYKEKKYEIHISHFASCKFRCILGLYSRDYKYKIGDIINIKNSQIAIVDQIRVNNKRGYKYFCFNCKCVHTLAERDLQEYGCAVCSNQVVFISVNDMWTTNPEVAKLLQNSSDGYLFSKCSNKKVNWICPNCGELIKNKGINQIYKQGLSCPRCSDGLPYGEKLIYNLLSQLGVGFEYHKTFDWSKKIKHNDLKLCGKKEYDFYFELKNQKYILEAHGLQHYKESFNKINSNAIRTLQQEQENDKLKEDLAIRNGVDKYIIIDTRNSELEWIKNSLLNSELKEILDLRNINWNKCHEFACNSLVKITGDLYNNGLKIQEIAEKLKLCRSTIRKYLKMGQINNLSNYNPDARKLKNNCMKIVQLNKKMNYIRTYNSILLASEELNINIYSLRDACESALQAKSAGGYKWMYLEDYERLNNNIITKR